MATSDSVSLSKLIPFAQLANLDSVSNAVQAQLLSATDTAASNIQDSSFKLPTSVSYDFGVAPIKTWVHILADSPCSRMGNYCALQNSNGCVNYPEFYKCTIDKDQPLMPEFLPRARISFT
ncbi:hypothetical protein WJX75_003907 [Coccomyxa subellipsoidea]|uniref:Pherophorin domain-containing protein n=1 Tax=Coccomyxa subellipsoidea TaxID=248742 RepID=A0ABR2YD73_9CHLO